MYGYLLFSMHNTYIMLLKNPNGCPYVDLSPFTKLTQINNNKPKTKKKIIKI